MTRAIVIVAVASLFQQSLVAADIAPITRRLPPQGSDLTQVAAQRLAEHLKQVQSEFNTTAKGHELAPDIAVYIKAVSYALLHHEFYKKGQEKLADDALRRARERIKLLEAGKSPWSQQRGLVVRGYRSSIDNSPQPYGLVIPPELNLDEHVPLYVWLHGRGDTKTDLHFIHERQTRNGQIAPPGAIVLHPFGRQCIGFKSAGEIDVLESIEHVCTQYKIDRQRIVLMGFSMGGAGCWHVGAHYTDHFLAMSPGAGFAETARYNRLTKDKYPVWYEQALWGQYDVPNYVRNLFNLPVIAYSGENDKQIQAARVMEAAFKTHGKQLTHIIGPGMGHKYHPDSLKSIMETMKSIVAQDQRPPMKVALQTRTLRYNKMHWVEAVQLGEHWQDSRIDAEIVGDKKVRVTTKNIEQLRLSPWAEMNGATVEIDGSVVKLADDSLLSRHEGVWQARPAAAEDTSSGKRHGLQGPIDDAFLAPFLVVLPSKSASSDAVQRWIDFEVEHLKQRWRALFRGDLPVKLDTEVTDDDRQRYNLILWGTPESNSLIRQYASSVLEHWDAKQLKCNGVSYDATTHLPLLIVPKPQTRKTYVVFNSGPTFREGHDRTNSLQNPKLPDWAVIDIRQPPNDVSPGKVVAADFFDEHWEFKKTSTNAKQREFQR